MTYIILLPRMNSKKLVYISIFLAPSVYEMISMDYITFLRLSIVYLL